MAAKRVGYTIALAALTTWSNVRAADHISHRRLVEGVLHSSDNVCLDVGTWLRTIEPLRTAFSSCVALSDALITIPDSTSDGKNRDLLQTFWLSAHAGVFEIDLGDALGRAVCVDGVPEYDPLHAVIQSTTVRLVGRIDRLKEVLPFVQYCPPPSIQSEMTIKIDCELTGASGCEAGARGAFEIVVEVPRRLGTLGSPSTGVLRIGQRGNASINLPMIFTPGNVKQVAARLRFDSNLQGVDLLVGVDDQFRPLLSSPEAVKIQALVVAFPLREDVSFSLIFTSCDSHSQCVHRRSPVLNRGTSADQIIKFLLDFQHTDTRIQQVPPPAPTVFMHTNESWLEWQVFGLESAVMDSTLLVPAVGAHGVVLRKMFGIQNEITFRGEADQVGQLLRSLALTTLSSTTSAAGTIELSMVASDAEARSDELRHSVDVAVIASAQHLRLVAPSSVSIRLNQSEARLQGVQLEDRRSRKMAGGEGCVGDELLLSVTVATRDAAVDTKIGNNPTSVALSPLGDSTLSSSRELRLNGTSCDIQKGLNSLMLKPAASMAAKVYREHQRFEVRIVDAKSNAINLLSRYTITAESYSSVTGAYVLGVTLPSGYNEGVNQAIEGITCETTLIHPSDTDAAIEEAIESMPCTVSATGISPVRSEIQHIVVDSVVPTTPLSSLSQTVIQLIYRGQTTEVTVGAAAATLQSSLRTLTGDVALVVSVGGTSDTSTMWQVSFSSAGSQDVISASVPSGSPALRLTYHVERRGIAAADLKLSLFYPQLKVSVRNTKTSEPLALELHVWTATSSDSDTATQLPTLEVLQSTLQGVTTGRSVSVQLKSISVDATSSQANPARFHLAIQGKMSAPLTIGSFAAEELRRAIEDMHLEGLDSVVVVSSASEGVYDKWVVELSYPQLLDIHPVIGNQGSILPTSVRIERVNDGALSFVVKDTLDIALYVQATATIVDRTRVPVRMSRAVNIPTIRVGDHVRQLRAGQSVTLDGILVTHGVDDLPVEMTAHASAGRIRETGVKFLATAMKLRELKKHLQSSQLLYSAEGDKTEPTSAEVMLSLVYTRADQKEVLTTTTVRLRVFPKVDVMPVYLDVPVQTVRAHSTHSNQLPGMRLSMRNESTLLVDYPGLFRLQVGTGSRSNGSVALEPALMSFMGSFVAASAEGSLEVTGSMSRINLALGGLIYTPPPTTSNDEILLRVSSLATSDSLKSTEAQALEYRLPVIIAPNEDQVLIRWDGKRLCSLNVEQVLEDWPLSLANLTVTTSGVEVTDAALRLNLTLKTSHGIFNWYNESSIEPPALSHGRDRSSVTMHGTTQSIQTMLQSLVYQPRRNYNGPDRIAMAVTPATHASSTPASEFLHVFVEPVDDEIQAQWEDSRTNVMSLSITSCCGRATARSLPRLLIQDEDDDSDAHAFFEPAHYLRVEVEVITRSGLQLHHSIVAVQRTMSEEGAVYQLAFQGRARDVESMLAGVTVFAESYKSISDTVLVRITKHLDHESRRMAPVEARVSVVVALEDVAVNPSKLFAKTQRRIQVVEDTPLDLKEAFAWSKTFPETSLHITMTVHHGTLHGSSGDFLSPRRNGSLVAHSFEDFKFLVDQLVYTSDKDFSGPDKLVFTAGDRSFQIRIDVTSVNDPPVVVLTAAGPTTQSSLRQYVPSFRVADPDVDEILTVEIAVNGSATLSANIERWREPSLWVQDAHTGETITRDNVLASKLRIHGTQDGINQVFEKPLEVEVVELLTHSPHSVSLSVCVIDRVNSNACAQRWVRFPSVDLMFALESSPLKLQWASTLPASALVTLTKDAIDEEEIVELRFSATHGSFQTMSPLLADHLIACGRSIELLRDSDSKHSVGVERFLHGSWSCLRTLLRRTVFRVSTRPESSASAIDAITIELSVGGSVRASQLIHYEILAPTPRYRIASSDENQRDEVDRVWSFNRQEQRVLSDFVELSILDANSEGREDIEGRLLSLNASCSLCLLSYDLSQHLVPSVVYVDGITQPSSDLHFYGTRHSLTRLLQTIGIHPMKTSSNGEGTIQIRVAEADEHFQDAVGSTRLSFKYNVTSTPQLQWVATKSHYRPTSLSGIVALDGVRLNTMYLDDPSTEVYVTLTCSDPVFVTANHPSIRVDGNLCDPAGGAVAFSSSLAKVNTVLGTLQVKAGSPRRIDRTSVLSLSARTHAVSTTAVEVHVDLFDVSGSRPDLYTLIQLATNRSITTEEDTSVLVGELFTVAHVDEDELFQLTATVTRGELHLSELSHVCCVHVMKSHSPQRLQLEGTLAELSKALAAAQYSPESEAFGNESIALSVSEENEDGEYAIRWTHSGLILVRPSNDAPIITIKQFPPRIVMRSGLVGETTTEFIEIDLSISVSDVDLAKTAALNDSRLSSLMQVTLNATGNDAYLSISSWQGDGADISIESRELVRRDDVLAVRTLAFRAPLATVNALLANATIACKAEGVRIPKDNPKDAYPRLYIAVNDLGHGVSSWTSQIAVQDTSSMEVQTGTKDTRRLSLSLASSISQVDASARVLTVTGVALASAYDVDQDSEEDRVIVKGSAVLRSVPEVQRIRLIGPQHLQRFSLTMEAPPNTLASSITGTFQLATTLPGSNHPSTVMVAVRAQACGMQLDELMGDEGTGGGIGESLESRLRVLYGDEIMARYQIHVVKTKNDDGKRITWQILAVISSGEAELPQLRVATTALVVGGGSATASVSSEQLVASFGGSFSLRLGNETTRALPADVGASELQDTLEELDAIDAVRVATTDRFTFDVMFLLPSSHLPLLTGDASRLTPFLIESDAPWPFTVSSGASVEISRVVEGQGQGSTYRVDVGGIHVSPVYQVEACANSTALGGGWFTLGFRQTGDPNKLVLAATDQIAVDAVAETEDEGVLQQAGGRSGSSMQSQLLRAMQQLPGYHLHFASVQVAVTRTSTATSPTTYVWTITFKNAPTRFPVLIVAAARTQPAASGVTVTATSVTPSNVVGGAFTLSFGRDSTPPLPVASSAREVEAALNKLSSIRDDQLGVGSIVVSQTQIPSVGGASFVVYFAEETAYSTRRRLTTDGAKLTGLGAVARVTPLTSWRSRGDDAGGIWRFPAFHHSPLDVAPSSSWLRGTMGSLGTDGFELRGRVRAIRSELRQVGYQLPDDWCGGFVSLILEALPEQQDSSDEMVRVRTDEAFLAPTAPRIDVEFDSRLGHTDEDETVIQVVVERGQDTAISGVRVRAPQWSHGLVWLRLRLSVEEGSVALLNRSVATPTSNDLWINGTVRMINSRLSQLVYWTQLSTRHVIDVLTVKVFDDAGTTHLATQAWLLQVEEAPLTPRVSMTLPTEDDGALHVVDAGRSIVMTGFQIVDANEDALGSRLFTAKVNLTVEAAVGQVHFDALDGLQPITHDGSRVALVGNVALLNRALNQLLYIPSQRYIHSKDTVTVTVASHPPHRPVLLDSRSVRLVVTPSNRVPRVTVGNSTAVTYAAKEDNGYQFPSLDLVDDQNGSDPILEQTSPRLLRQPVVELRRTELTAPTVTKSPVYDEDDDWRHRWIADLPGLSARVSFTAVSSSAFLFTGSDTRHGEELWISDGTTNGSQLVADLLPGNLSSRPSDLVVLSSVNKVIFAADGVDDAWMLQSERSRNSVRASSVDPDLQYVVSASNTWDPTASYDCPELGWHWATSAEATTRLKKAIANLTEPYVFWDTCDWDGYVFGAVVRKSFRFADSASTGAMKHAGRRDSAPIETSFSTTEFAGIVCVHDGASTVSTSATGRELWIVDASHQPGRPKRLRDIEVGPRSSHPRFLTPYKSSVVLFQATTASLGAELYKSDGTAAGTVLLVDLWRGPRSSDPSDFVEWTTGDGRMYFAATTESGRELWSTDGTAASSRSHGPPVGTFLVADICGGTGDSNPRFLTAFGTLGVVFAATDCVNGRELWGTDGTSAGTRMIVDLNPTAGADSDPSDFVVFDNKLYFSATMNAVAMDRELFVSDGTAGGTQLLKQIAPGVGSSAPSRLTIANGKLLFHATDDTGRGALWMTDGTSAEMTSIWSSGFSLSHQLSRYQPAKLLAINNAVYYLVERIANVSDMVAVSRNPDLELEVSVNHGTISVHSKLYNNDTHPQPSLRLHGTRTQLREALRRLVFHPPQNWNVLHAAGDHTVHWRFSVSSLSSSAVDVQTTTAALIVRPTIDPPVIEVPSFRSDAIRSALDYVSLLRVQCLPLTVLEDIPTPLRGFSARGVDDRDGRHIWTLDVTAVQGTVSIADRSGCVSAVIVNNPQHVKMQSARIACLARLLSGLIYTSKAHASGSDVMKIQVMSALTTDPVRTLSSDAAEVPIIVTEVNDAPYLTSLDGSGFFYFAREDEALVISDLRVVDPDAATQEDLITVEVDVRHGTVTVLHKSDSVIVVHSTRASDIPSASASAKLVLRGPLHEINLALSSLVYTSARDWNSLLEDAFDVVTVRLSDTQKFNSTTSTLLMVDVASTPDAVIITRPRMWPTSVYASVEDDALHVDEDTWLEIDKVAFSSVDDTRRTMMSVAVHVGNGRLTMDASALSALTTVDDSTTKWTLRGHIDAVNAAMTTLRYLPTSNFYGDDVLEIHAQAVDVYARQESIPATMIVPITIHAVNDVPVWTLPSSSVQWTQGRPTRVFGVSLSDVDCGSACEMEIVVETIGSALVTFPQLPTPLQFSTSRSTAQSTFAVLRGPLTILNVALSELVVTTTDPDAVMMQPAELWFTADDLGHTGSGGPQLARRRLLVTPLMWISHALELSVPNATVLAIDEDTPLRFDAGAIRFIDRDSATRSTAALPQYQVAIEVQHGRFHLATEVPSATLGLHVLPSESTRVLRLRGFLPQINTALDGSMYTPDENWSGADEIRIVARQLDGSPDLPDTAGSIAVFIAPVCDTPRWGAQPDEQDIAVISLDEDSQVLLALKWLNIHDVDSSNDVWGQRDLLLTVEVLDSGGVMLLQSSGLTLSLQKSPAWTTPATWIQFYEQVTLRGTASRINAALAAMIYRPKPDFHTNGHARDAMRLTITSVDTQCNGRSVAMVRALILAMNDPPVLVGSPQFTTLAVSSQKEVFSLSTDYGSIALEAYGDQPLQLDAIIVKDVDYETTDENEVLGDLRVRISCRSCAVQSALSVEELQRVHGVLVFTDLGRRSPLWSLSTVYHAPISVLNNVLLQSLRFTSVNHFHGLAVVLLELSDLGYDGRGGPRETAFAMVVRVHGVNDAPQIHTPPYGTLEPPLVVDEQASVLLRGAQPLRPRREQHASRTPPTWQLSLVVPDAVDATSRITSLLDLDAFEPEQAMGFYTALHPQQLLFSAFSPAAGQELWITDGTRPGTRLLADLNPGHQGSRPEYLTRFSVDGQVYFGAEGMDTDAWRLPVDYRDACNGFRENAFVPGVYYVVAQTASWGIGERYDCPSGYKWMTTAEAQRVFIGSVATVDDDRKQREEPLAYYDECGWEGYDWGGVSRWHFRFADSHITGAFKHAGQRDSYRVDVGVSTDGFAGIVCRRRTADDPEDLAADVVRALWTTDGTTSGTHRVAAHAVDPRFITDFNRRLYFQAKSDAYGVELWRSDGSRLGTELVADVAFGEQSSTPQQLTVANGRLFFTADTPSYGRELWVSDGDVRTDYEQVDHGSPQQGTRLVLDIYAGVTGSTPSYLVAIDLLGIVLFQADDGVHGAELWRSDGTPQGTRMVLDIFSGAWSSSPKYLTLFSGRIFFQADDGVHGVELWSTDGSASGTMMLTDLVAGSGSSAPRYLSVPSVGAASLVFTASTDRDPSVVEFWKSDGTAAGTQRMFGVGSREVTRINDRAMEAMHRPVVLSATTSGFVVFSEKLQSMGTWDPLAKTRAISRSLTLTDESDDDGGKTYGVTIRAGEGSVSLHGDSTGCDVDVAATEPQPLIELNGTLAYLNCALTEVVYHAGRSVAADVDGGWTDTITVTLTEGSSDVDADGRVYSATESIPVRVTARNHAPVVDVQARVFSSVDEWTRVPVVSVSDEDAGDKALLFVRLTASLGRVRMTGDWEDLADVVVIGIADPRGAPAVEFSATLPQINRLVEEYLEYACLRADGCVDGVVDTLRILVDDNGFTGAGGAQATTATSTIVVVNKD